MISQTSRPLPTSHGRRGSGPRNAIPGKSRAFAASSASSPTIAPRDRLVRRASRSTRTRVASASRTVSGWPLAVVTTQRLQKLQTLRSTCYHLQQGVDRQFEVHLVSFAALAPLSVELEQRVRLTQTHDIARGRSRDVGDARAPRIAERHSAARERLHRVETLVDVPVMAPAEQDEVVHLGRATVGPMTDVVSVDEPVVLAPGKRQPRSRRCSARRIGGGIVRVLRPTGSISPSNSVMRTSEESQESRLAVSLATAGPSLSSQPPPP